MTTIVHLNPYDKKDEQEEEEKSRIVLEIYTATGGSTRRVFNRSDCVICTKRVHKKADVRQAVRDCYNMLRNPTESCKKDTWVSKSDRNEDDEEEEEEEEKEKKNKVEVYGISVTKHSFTATQLVNGVSSLLCDKGEIDMNGSRSIAELLAFSTEHENRKTLFDLNSTQEIVQWLTFPPSEWMS